MLNEKIDNIVSKINKLIIDEKLEKIIEMTYSYKHISNNRYYNISLFEDFLWIYYVTAEEIDYEKIKESLKNKIFSVIKKFDWFIDILKKEALNDKWQILYGSLMYNKKILEVVSLWILFELEKAWYVIDKSKEELLKIISKIEEIEEENFWLKIKNSLPEVEMIHNHLFNIFLEHKKNLSENEQVFFLKYINRLNIFLGGENLKISKTKKKKWLLKIFETSIKRDDYINIFNYVIKDIYWFKQEAIITDASSIYDWEKYLEIPNKDIYSTLSIKRILELIIHEVECHYVNWYNNKILLWNFKWARNLEKEEWLAKVMEALLFDEKVVDMSFVPTYMSKILYSELYSWSSFLKFMTIYNKMYKLSRMPIHDVLRQKRNYSLSLKWGQHKDISYGRWINKVVNYLDNNGDFSLLFMSKVWFDYLPMIEKMYSDNKNQLILPLFVSDIIKLFLEYKSRGKVFNLDVDSISIYLEKKYNYTWIEKFKFSKNIWKKIKKIEKLLNMIDDLV